MEKNILVARDIFAIGNKKEDQSIGQSLLSMGKVRSVSGVSFTLVSADLSSEIWRKIY
jgi:hypothetical protein